jgi:hypothetical protein
MKVVKAMKTMKGIAGILFFMPFIPFMSFMFAFVRKLLMPSLASFSVWHCHREAGI